MEIDSDDQKGVTFLFGQPAVPDDLYLYPSCDFSADVTSFVSVTLLFHVYSCSFIYRFAPRLVNASRYMYLPPMRAM